MKSDSTPSHRSAGTFILLLVIIAIFAGSYFARQWISERTAPAISEQVSYERLVALSPSCVEIIYQLDLQDRLVGVSRFCAYPPEASEKPVVGGYVDLDFEHVLRLDPDCVILLTEQHALAERLKKLGIHTIAVDHASTTGITDSITTLGKALGKPKASIALVDAMQTRLKNITKRKKDSTSTPRVLISIDRDTTASYPDRLIAAGREGVHQEYLTMVGATNAYQGPVPYPSLSREKLIQANPDIIIDLIRDEVWQELGEEKLLAQWNAFPELTAVRNKHIIFLHEHQHMIPGPRFVATVEAIDRAIKSLPPPSP